MKKQSKPADAEDGIEIIRSPEIKEKAKQFAHYIISLNLSDKKALKLANKAVDLLKSAEKDAYSQGIDFGVHMEKWLETDRKEQELLKKLKRSKSGIVQ